MDQDAIFERSEGDAYFRRNMEAMAVRDMSTDLPMRLMSDYRLQPKTVLEVGASNGFRLDAIRQQYGARCCGVEPSLEALDDARRRYPQVHHSPGVAHEIPWVEPFDLVIVNYVLHWVDRRHLLRSIAEIDRLIKDGGCLIVGDFAPANRVRVPYRHKDGVYTYKQDYEALFLASGLYEREAYLSGPHGHGELAANVPDHERAFCCLLRKSLNDYYQGGGALVDTTKGA